MITTVTVERTITEERPVSRTCNGCGLVEKAICYASDGSTAWGDHEFGNGIHIDERGGYHSRIGDGERYSFDLCDRCIIKLMESFVVPAFRQTCHPITGIPEE
jgi:hypothetical protein